MASLRPYLGHFLAQMEASGVENAVVAPGSRSTPLAILLYESTATRLWMALDERSAAYFALGMAKSLGNPVALLCTSGTAAANFLPAIAEAHLSRIPLIVLTADRPRELRDVGAAQTIHQANLYGNHVKWFQDLPTPSEADLRYHAAQVAARAIHIATSHPQGPVHLNFPLREPLLPEIGEPLLPLMGGLWPPVEEPLSEALEAAVLWAQDARRPLVIAGPESPTVPDFLLNQLASKHWPVLADPLAHMRGQHGVISTYDSFLRTANKSLKPDLVIRLGAPPTSKTLNLWSAEARLVLVDWPLGFREPQGVSSLIVEGDPHRVITRLIALLPPANGSWVRAWQHQENFMRRHLNAFLEDSPDTFEGRLYADLNALLANRAAPPILIASSMPIRDLDTFYHGGTLTFYANRGANGIDGLVSTALGISAQKGDVLAILGDLAFYHDMNGLLLAKLHRLNAFIVIINNNGGSIFSYLSQGALPEDMFETLFGTPHDIDFSGVETLYGAIFRRASGYGDFVRNFRDLMARPGLRVLEWRCSTRKNTVELHRRLYAHSPKGSE